VQTMAAGGLTFADLEPGARYVAYAEPNGGAPVWFDFTAGEDENPSAVITARQRRALVGTAGEPDSDNPYVTDQDDRLTGRVLYRAERDSEVSGTGVAGTIHTSDEISMPRFVRVTVVAAEWQVERDEVDNYGYIAVDLFQGAPTFENERIIAVRRVTEDHPYNAGPLYAAGVFDLGEPGGYHVHAQIEPGGAGSLATNVLVDADDLDGNDRESGIQVWVESEPELS